MTTFQNRSPWMHSVILTTHATVYNLFTLVKSITPGISQYAQSVKLQVDVGAGAAKVYVGSPDSLATNDCGVSMVATQNTEPAAFTSDCLELADITLLTDTDGTQVNVTIICR
jgi:hypothetical protein